ncbi:hypothetical protein [uncultured Tateyamaria sp.]|uniref:hypothetical protein n=1 Tax=uncultured Tateyamaria sp. TaxID=455651 RepID=UPI002636589A|nr:hypothetical protein [uncultured Tateyamaria sp.]
MNANQIINMVMRIIMRKAINSGINAGVNRIGRGRKSGPPPVQNRARQPQNQMAESFDIDDDAPPTQAEIRQVRAARRAAKQARAQNNQG